MAGNDTGGADTAGRIRSSFERQRYMETIGATLLSVEPGRVSIRLPFRDDLTQQHGYLHAGVVGAALDSACGYAAYSMMPEGMAVLTVEYKINLLAPAAGTEFVATARVLRAGRTLSVCTAEMVARSAGGERTIAAMQATIMGLPNQRDRRD